MNHSLNGVERSSRIFRVRLSPESLIDHPPVLSTIEPIRRQDEHGQWDRVEGIGAAFYYGQPALPAAEIPEEFAVPYVKPSTVQYYPVGENDQNVMQYEEVHVPSRSRNYRGQAVGEFTTTDETLNEFFVRCRLLIETRTCKMHYSCQLGSTGRVSCI